MVAVVCMAGRSLYPRGAFPTNAPGAFLPMFMTALILILIANAGTFLIFLRGGNAAHAAIFVLLTVVVGVAVSAFV